MKTLTKYSVFLGLLAMSVLVACSPAQVTLSLRVALNAAQLALSAITSPDGTQLPGAAQASVYIAEAATATSQVGAIIAGPGTDATKAAAIAAALASIIGADPHLPTGTPKTIVTAIGTLAQALQGVLATYGPQPAPPPSRPGVVAASRSVSAPDLQKAKGDFLKIAAQAKATAAAARAIHR